MNDAHPQPPPAYLHSAKKGFIYVGGGEFFCRGGFAPSALPVKKGEPVYVHWLKEGGGQMPDGVKEIGERPDRRLQDLTALLTTSHR